MKEDEWAKIIRMTKALGVVLDIDLDGTDEQVRLEGNTRAHIEAAMMGGLELLRGPVEKHDKKGALAKSNLAKAQELYFDDGELFGADGEPTEAAEGGKRPETERTFGEDEPGLFPEDEDGEVDGDEDEPEHGNINSAIPPNVRAGLRQALSDGSGPKKACTDVAKAIGLDFSEVRDIFDQLERNGKIGKVPATNGRAGKTDYVWIADDSDEDLEPDADGVVATSETPEPVGF